MVYTFNPLKDHRWPEFVARHDKSSVFHGTGWLDALRRTYGYEPVVYSTSPPAATLTNGVVFCRVDSWLTGRRLVSLPFADHCEPLIDDPNDRVNLFEALTRAIDGDSRMRRLKYIEIRPRSSDAWVDPAAAKASSFAFHVLDLRPTTEDIYQRIHKSALQRKIRRGARESLSYEAGSSEALLSKFYRLVLLTRRRHMLPPQPVEWFRNLADCMRNQLTIRVASKDGRPVASILTLHSRDTMVYKYGCSDARYHNLGAVPFLLWKAIEEARGLGIQELDLGRSDRDNIGLITFKERWGSSPSELTYVRYTADRSQKAAKGSGTHPLRHIFAWMPDRLLTTTGKLLYRHIG